MAPGETQGLENKSAIFSASSNATTALESIVSIGHVGPGETRGTIDSWIGIWGAFTSTFANWLHVSQRNPRHEGTRKESRGASEEKSRSRSLLLAAIGPPHNRSATVAAPDGQGVQRVSSSRSPPLAAPGPAAPALNHFARTAGRAAAAVVMAARRAADAAAGTLCGRRGPAHLSHCD